MTNPSFEKSTILDEIVKSDTEAPRGGAAVYAMLVVLLLVGAFCAYGLWVMWSLLTNPLQGLVP